MLNRVKAESLIHYSLFTISAYMSILMFIVIGNSIETKIALIILAIILEVSKIIDLQKSSIKTIKKLFHIISYILKASLSIIASVGLVITLINSQEIINKDHQESSIIDLAVYKDNITYWESEIIDINRTIELLNNNLSRNPEGYGTASKHFVSQIEILQERKIIYHKELNSAKIDYLERRQELDSRKEATIVNMFIELEKILPFSANQIKIVVFSLIMILIETSMALLNPNSQKPGNTLRNQNDSKINNNMNMIKKNNDMLFKQNSFDTKGLTIAKEIARIQYEKESIGERTYTYSEIAKRLNIKPHIVGNTYRRHIIPTLKEYGLNTFHELHLHWKK